LLPLLIAIVFTGAYELCADGWVWMLLVPLETITWAGPYVCLTLTSRARTLRALARMDAAPSNLGTLFREHSGLFSDLAAYSSFWAPWTTTFLPFRIFQTGLDFMFTINHMKEMAGMPLCLWLLYNGTQEVFLLSIVWHLATTTQIARASAASTSAPPSPPWQGMKRRARSSMARGRTPSGWRKWRAAWASASWA